MEDQDPIIDLNKTGGLTLDDLDFGEEVKIGTQKEVVVEPLVKEPTIEDIKIEPIKNEVIFDDDKTIVEDKKSAKDLRIQGIRAGAKYLAEHVGYEATEDEIDALDENGVADFYDNLFEAVTEYKWNSVKQVDETINKLLTYIELGKDPKEIATIIQESNDVASIDTTTDTGKIKYVRAYYKDVLGWDSDRVQKKIDRISKIEEGLKEEVEEIQPEFQKHFEQKQNKLIEQAERSKAQEKILLEKKQNNFFETLKEEKFSQKDATAYYKVAFEKTNYQGQTMDILDAKILDMQKNPKTFLKLVQFITDPNRYDEIVSSKKDSKKVTTEMENKFKFGTERKSDAFTKEKESTITTPKFKF